LQAEGRVAVYDNVFINGSGDAIHIQPHNDVPRDMAIFSNTVLASGVGIQVRQAAHAAYRQRVIGNVVAAVTPLLGGETAHNLTLAYRPDCLNVTVPGLMSCLLAKNSPSDRLPYALVQELGAYPDWQAHSEPGAHIPPTLLRTLGDLPP
jgi:hypothetical protein